MQKHQENTFGFYIVRLTDGDILPLWPDVTLGDVLQEAEKRWPGALYADCMPTRCVEEALAASDAAVEFAASDAAVFGHERATITTIRRMVDEAKTAAIIHRVVKDYYSAKKGEL